MMDNLVTLNWELAIAWLDDAIAELEKCTEHLNKLEGNVSEFKEAIGADESNKCDSCIYKMIAMSRNSD